MKHKFLLKGVKRVMSANRDIMLMVLFWILEELTEDKETEVTNDARDLIKCMLGVEVDTSELRNV